MRNDATLESKGGDRVDTCPYFSTIETPLVDSCNLSEALATPVSVVGYARQFAQACCSSSSDNDNGDDVTKIGQLECEDAGHRPRVRNSIPMTPDSGHKM